MLWKELLQHSGTCVRVAGGHADRKQLLGLELSQWCCPGKQLAGSGVGPSRSLLGDGAPYARRHVVGGQNRYINLLGGYNMVPGGYKQKKRRI